MTDDCIVGEVSAALLAGSGRLYTGLSIEASSGIGFCAEHSAVAQMLTAGESHIHKIVAVAADGQVLPPCGRCRELLYLIDRRNLQSEIVLGPDRSRSLAELLPER
ncbi:MAG: cytidine deaminase [Chloroflexi bacterium]|nr:cytidine deaminase [Chloroflexota bacterium]MCI0576984.1 cytidine deaminase [Chloroflexota bacterium]MCI0730574.1 cytidine deaminase [Chloroflexota bacterium]